MAFEPAGHFERIAALAASPRLLFLGGRRGPAGAASGESQITIWDHLAGKPVGAVSIAAHVLALVVTEQQVLAACADGKVRIFGHDGKAAREIAAHNGPCHALAIQGDDLLTAGADGAVRTFALKTGKTKREALLSPLPLRALALDPSGESIAAGGDDGVIRVLREGDERRDMPGHDGAVRALAFSPTDGRLVSAGEDGTVRVWYLVGAAESEVRTKDDTLHVGGATALLFPPAKDAAEVGDRVLSAGADGKVRLWRMSDRRKPRTFDAGNDALEALAFAPTKKPDSFGAVIAAGEGRTIHVFPFDGAGAPTDRAIRVEHGFDVQKSAFAAPAKATREAAIRLLAPMEEREALDLLLGRLAEDKEPDLRALVASELARHGRRDARKALRLRIDDESGAVRAAALDALRRLEEATPLAPLRTALDSRFADMRVAALGLLPALAETSPLASGLIAGRVADDDAKVRATALAKLVELAGSAILDALKTGFDRGKADVRAEVLVRGFLAGLDREPAFSSLVGRGLDDEDAAVRRVAFVVTVLFAGGLGGWLSKRDEAFGRAFDDFVQRAALVKGLGPSLPEGTDPDLAEVKSLSTAFAQFTHPKLGLVAIFKPTIHTPLKVGDKVYLVGVKPVGPEGHQQLRATDYLAGAAASAPALGGDLAALKKELVGAGGTSSPKEKDREPLLAALACRTPDTSLRGARGLALLGDLRALGALLTISRESDPALRREAAFALVALEDPRAKRRLVWMLDDPEASVRDAALVGFARLEKDPEVVAEAALHSSHEDIRVRGLDALVKEGKGKPSAELLLGDAIEDESAKVRGEAFRTLWAWHEKDPLKPLDRALAARFPDLRGLAVKELTALAKEKMGGAGERLAKAIGDRDLGVARAAYEATLELRGKAEAATYLAAIDTTHPALRARAAKDAAEAKTVPHFPVAALRSPLSKLLEDSEAGVRTAAIDALDVLVPEETGAVAIGLHSSHLDLRVRAAELLAVRRDDAIIEPMRSLLADKELLVRLPPAVIVPLRQRAATALANLGSPRLLKYFATELVKDDDPIVREQAARGLSNASRRGEEGYLLDLLGHAELAIRSWAAEGLARLGDARALPVLTGTLKHEHPPIRIGAILSFAALGPDGAAGMLQGLADPSLDVQRVVLAIVLARDLAALRRKETPDLLTSALSSQRPEVCFAAARALELRIIPEQYLANLVDLLLPDRPEKATDMERWPDEATRTRLMVGLAEALAGDRPEQRYAAAQALRLRDRPLDYFREIQRAVAPRSIKAPWTPDTTPRGPAPASPTAAKKGPLGLLRRLFSSGAEADDGRESEPPPPPASSEEATRLRLLAFGAYVGLLRQATPDDEAHRVRRDAIERIVALESEGHVSRTSVIPALARALDDPNHLVRQAAFGALKKTHPKDPATPLVLALGSTSADVIRSALDELAAAGPSGRAKIERALDSPVAQARKYAFDLLEKLSPPGSLEPLLAALASEHADIRIGVLERLTTSQDARVASALGEALKSEHDDLRLRAAEMLAARRDDRAAEPLGAWLRSDDPTLAERARTALATLGTTLAVRVLVARLDDEAPEAERVAIAGTIAAARAPRASSAGSLSEGEASLAAIDALVRLFADEHATVRRAAFDGAIAILGPRSDAPAVRGKPRPPARSPKLELRLLEGAVRSRHADVRGLAARELDDLSDKAAAAALLVRLFGDRDRSVRATAVHAYAMAAGKRIGSLAERAPRPAAERLAAKPLEDVIRGGARETMLSAAWGLAQEENAVALRPLLLFTRAGEGFERVRAILGLGCLGDPRALPELETIASGGTEEAPAEPDMQAAALEALGRIFRKLVGEDQERIRDRIESSVGTKDPLLAIAAVKALRWIGDERSAARIGAILGERSSSEPEQVEAAEALGWIDAATVAEPALARALDSDRYAVRWAARDALDRLFPTDRTRVEFLAVESKASDIAAPAAAYLANEGDPGRLLEKLARLTNAELRERLRFGLVRRPELPLEGLGKLLAEGSASARADAAWVLGGRARTLGAAPKALGASLLSAAKRAETGFFDAARAGKSAERDAEAKAWSTAVWAGRLLAAGAIRADARRWHGLVAELPIEVRREATHALAGGGAEDRKVLVALLADRDASIRTAAAASLAPAADLRDVPTTPFDPTRTGLALEGSPVSAKELADARARQAFLPTLARTGADAPLRELAEAKAPARIDAIAALGRVATDGGIATLEGILASEKKAEDVRKAAFRSLRRAQRTRERRAALAAKREKEPAT